MYLVGGGDVVKPKKKKFFIIIIVSLIVLWLGIFTTDYTRCNSLKAPIFVVPGKTADDGGSGKYYGLGYTVKIKKYIDAEYGVSIESVEMYVLGKIVSASIQ